MAGLMVNAAFAFDCSNPNINDHAVVAVYDEATDTLTFTKSNWGVISEEKFKLNGAFVKIILVSGESFNIFVINVQPDGVLPDGALNSGPGSDLCDGKGIDDVDACLS
jgi:hypothetical protein